MNKYMNETQRISWHRGSEPPAGDTWALIMLDADDDSVDYLYAHSNPYWGFWMVWEWDSGHRFWEQPRKFFWNDVYAWFPAPAPVNWNAVVEREDDKN